MASPLYDLLDDDKGDEGDEEMSSQETKKDPFFLNELIPFFVATLPPLIPLLLPPYAYVFMVRSPISLSSEEDEFTREGRGAPLAMMMKAAVRRLIPLSRVTVAGEDASIKLFHNLL